MLVSRNTRLPRRKLVLFFGDGICTAGALLLSIFLRLGFDDGLAYISEHQVAIGLAVGAFLVAFYIGGLYESARLVSFGRTLAAAVVSVALGGLLIAAIFYAVLIDERIGRGIFLGFSTFVLVGVVGMRLLYISATRHGFMGQRCLVIGTREEARRVIELVHDHTHAGLKILGLIHCDARQDAVGQFVDDYPVLGTMESLDKFVDLYGIDRLILAASIDFEPVLLRRLRAFRYRGLTLVDFVTLHEELAQEIPVDHINDEWLFLASTNNSQFHIRRMKRLVDILASTAGLVLTLPLTLGAALLVKLTSRGPVLYRQERLGRDSVPFMVMKFRTMRENAERDTGPVWSMDDDPRITMVGKWLRKFRIDEIPQLWNVLQGEMSLVGPRPERAVFIKKLSEKVPFYAERLLVPPGITGWAQVMHPYTASIEESRRKLQFDLYYIKHMSFLLDVYIMIKTVKTILFGRERLGKRQRQRQRERLEERKPESVEVKTQMLVFESPDDDADDSDSASSAATKGRS